MTGLAAVFPLLMIIAGTGDVLTMRISNRLNLLIAGLFFPVALASGMPWEVMGLHAATGAAMLVLGIVLFSLGLFGGGDAKLIAAASLWLGLSCVPFFLFVTSLAGLFLAIWAVGRALLAYFAATPRPPALGLRRLDVPYGYALAAGAIVAFPESWWMAGGS